MTGPPVASVGYALPASPMDVVTVYHDQTDHSNTAGVRGTFTVVDGRAGAAERYRAIYYDGGHKFDRSMQADAFDRFLKPAPAKR